MSRASGLPQRTLDRIIKMIPDMEAYVEVASGCETRRKYIVGTLLHDILGTVSGPKSEFFTPRTEGYAKYKENKIPV